MESLWLFGQYRGETECAGKKGLLYGCSESSPASEKVEQRLQETNHKKDKRKPATVQALPNSPALTEVLKPAVPVLAAFGKGLIVIVLLFFLLYSRRDLRDRFVRLAARVRIPIAAQGIETAGDTVGRYLFLLFR